MFARSYDPHSKWDHNSHPPFLPHTSYDKRTEREQRAHRTWREYANERRRYAHDSHVASREHPPLLFVYARISTADMGSNDIRPTENGIDAVNAIAPLLDECENVGGGSISEDWRGTVHDAKRRSTEGASNTDDHEDADDISHDLPPHIIGGEIMSDCDDDNEDVGRI